MSARILFAVVALAASHTPATPAGKVCFSRADGPGVPNPQTIHVWGTQAGKRRKVVDLIGQGKACASLAAGKWTLDARSARPGAAKSGDQNECGSAPLVIDVAKGAEVDVFVSPLGGPTMMCGWELN